ncbi:hypothetical protein [Baaleninema simplex]|uniref:hypothetical protein n=1 Tax=Baaleninema simplex TaxID=2862350 RepID=UPI0008FC0563|nr:hypothetical protein [Baaleninema simplex]
MASPKRVYGFLFVGSFSLSYNHSLVRRGGEGEKGRGGEGERGRRGEGEKGRGGEGGDKGRGGEGGDKGTRKKLSTVSTASRLTVKGW